MLGQLHVSLRLDADAGAGRDVIEDHRLGAGVGDGVVHRHQTALGGLVVVGGHDQNGIGTVGAGALGQLHGVVGLVGAGAGDDRHPAVDPLAGVGDGAAVLGVGQGGAFAGGAADDQGVDPLGDLPVDQGPEAVKINAFGGGGGDKGGSNASENRILVLHGKFLLHNEIFLSIPARSSRPPQKRQQKNQASYAGIAA